MPKSVLLPNRSQAIAIVLAWAAATAIALVSGGLLMDAGFAGGFFLIIVGIPLLLGILQSLVVMYCLPRAGWWIVSTTAGGAAAWGCALVCVWIVAGVGDSIGGFPFSVSTGVASAMLTAIGGAAIGVCQWLYLRNHVRHAFRWLGASAIAVMVGGGPSFYQGISSFSGGYNWVGLLVVGGLVGGAIKGVALVLLLQNPKQIIPKTTESDSNP